MIHPDAPAFPETHVYHWRGQDKEVGETDNVLPRYMSGLTKREYIAVEAMKSFITVARNPETYEHIAQRSTDMANAMIERLSR